MNETREIVPACGKKWRLEDGMFSCTEPRGLSEDRDRMREQARAFKGNMLLSQ